MKLSCRDEDCLVEWFTQFDFLLSRRARTGKLWKCQGNYKQMEALVPKLSWEECSKVIWKTRKLYNWGTCTLLSPLIYYLVIIGVDHFLISGSSMLIKQHCPNKGYGFGQLLVFSIAFRLLTRSSVYTMVCSIFPIGLDYTFLSFMHGDVSWNMFAKKKNIEVINADIRIGLENP